MSSKLKNLLVPSKETVVDFPGKPGFKVNLCFLSRETIQDLKKKSTKQTYKKHQPVEEFDEDVFLELYVNATVTGWEGLTFKYLQDLAPIEIPEGSEDDILEYTPEEALMLMKSSTAFDQFVSEYTSDLGNFT